MAKSPTDTNQQSSENTQPSEQLKKRLSKKGLEGTVGLIIYGGSSDEKRAAFQLTKSESARCEAEMIQIFQQAQAEIIATLASLKARNLVTYHTEAALKRVERILAQMLGNCKDSAKQMVEANILSSKIKAFAASDIKGEKLVKATSLTSIDKERVKRMVEQLTGTLTKGASLAMASVRNTVQNVSIRANMPNPIQNTVGTTNEQKESKEAQQKGKAEKRQKEDEEKFSQSPVSNMLAPEDLRSKRTQQPYRKVKKITESEIKDILKNPVFFAQNKAKQNIQSVIKMRENYVLGRREIDPLRTEALRSQALKEAKGSSALRATFNMQEQLRKEGVAAFIDRGGHKWTLANYCAMSARTTSRQSSNFGELFAKEDHDLYYIVPHSTSCPICSKYEGRVYSRSGKNPNYPPLSVAFSKIDPNGTDDLENTYLTIHPNCRHTIVRFIERAQTPKKLYEIRKKSNAPFEVDPRTAEQIKEYKEREKVFAKRNAAMREYQKFLQVIPVKELKRFPTFEKHYYAKDDVYKKLKKRYSELSSPK